MLSDIILQKELENVANSGPVSFFLETENIINKYNSGSVE